MRAIAPTRNPDPCLHHSECPRAVTYHLISDTPTSIEETHNTSQTHPTRSMALTHHINSSKTATKPRNLMTQKHWCAPSSLTVRPSRPTPAASPAHRPGDQGQPRPLSTQEPASCAQALRTSHRHHHHHHQRHCVHRRLPNCQGPRAAASTIAAHPRGLHYHHRTLHHRCLLRFQGWPRDWHPTASVCAVPPPLCQLPTASASALPVAVAAAPAWRAPL